MPHFIIDCNATLLEQQTPEHLMQTVHDCALKSGLFDPDAIKVRINPYTHYLTSGRDDDFLHIFGNIMEGRNVDQKHALSESMITTLKPLFPDIPVLTINIREFEKATYYNQSYLE